MTIHKGLKMYISEQYIEEGLGFNLKPNPNPISIDDVKTAAKIAMLISIDMTKLMKNFSSYKINRKMFINDHLWVNGNALKFPILAIDFVFWGDKDESKYDIACEELIKITQVMNDLFIKKYKFKIKSRIDNDVIFIKNNSILYGISSDGDKCDECFWNFSLFGSNVSDFDEISVNKIGFKI